MVECSGGGGRHIRAHHIEKQTHGLERLPQIMARRGEEAGFCLVGLLDARPCSLFRFDQGSGRVLIAVVVAAHSFDRGANEEFVDEKRQQRKGCRPVTIERREKQRDGRDGAERRGGNRGADAAEDGSEGGGGELGDVRHSGMRRAHQQTESCRHGNQCHGQSVALDDIQTGRPSGRQPDIVMSRCGIDPDRTKRKRSLLY